MDPQPSLWRIIERTWLDVVTPPMSERLAAAGFTPDPLWAYCPRCGLSVGPHDATLADGCAACRPGSPTADRLRLCRRGRGGGGWERVVRLGEYRHPLRPMIHDVKFTAWRRLGDDLGRLLGESIRAALDDAREDGLDPLPAGTRPIVVPVPSSTWRRMSRGIDHAAVVARGVCRSLDAEFSPILRRRHRPAQTSLAASQRVRNVAGTIHPRKSPWPFNRSGAPPQRGQREEGGGGGLVIVVDDIMTTGATLRAACRAVRAHLDARGGGQTLIWAAVLGRTPLETAKRGEPRDA